MKKNLCLVILFCALVVSGCAKTNQTQGSVDNFTLDGKNMTFSIGDKLLVNNWGEEAVVTYNEKSYEKSPTLYKGITIGSRVEEMVKAFDLEEGYALVNREVDGVDGSTDIIDEEYKNLDVMDKRNNLDVTFMFAYEQKDGSWNKVPNDELLKIDNTEDDTKKKNMLVFLFNVCGRSMVGDKLDTGEIAIISVLYQ